MSRPYTPEELTRWKPLLEAEAFPKITDYHRKHDVAVILENTAKEVSSTVLNGLPQVVNEAAVPVNFMGSSSSTAGAGGIDTFDPVLISMVRRSMPNLNAYDLCGVQPMTGPSGLIFAYRSRYSNQTGAETFYNEVNTAYSTAGLGADANVAWKGFKGTIPGDTNTSPLTNTANYNTGSAMSRAQAEALGTDSNTAFPQMAFTIEKISVTANTRALAASYTIELAQDLRAIHGLEAETELSNMMTAEVLAEINREIIRTINISAVPGSQKNVTTPGVFDLDTDSNGRWMVEKFKGLMYHLTTEANQIAKDTRRGLGNIILCSADVASALQMAGVLDYTPALDGNRLEVDDTGNTFAGILNGRFKVYIDPYAIGGQYFTMGLKGKHPFDAGIFYCPYVPLQMLRAVDPASFDPSIGFKTRYGLVANPFAQGLTKGSGAITPFTNLYYRRSIVANLMG